jgi:hypothetical protein
MKRSKPKPNGTNQKHWKKMTQEVVSKVLGDILEEGWTQLQKCHKEVEVILNLKRRTCPLDKIMPFELHPQGSLFLFHQEPESTIHHVNSTKVDLDDSIFLLLSFSHLQ